MPETQPGSPYDTHLDIKYGPLELIDVPALVAAGTHPWFNQTLCGNPPGFDGWPNVQ